MKKSTFRKLIQIPLAFHHQDLHDRLDLLDRIELNLEKIMSAINKPRAHYGNQDNKHRLIGEIYRHLKTGGKYEFLGMALLEATKETAVIYRCLESEMVWVRPASEFFDGRFQIVVPEQNQNTHGWDDVPSPEHTRQIC